MAFHDFFTDGQTNARAFVFLSRMQPLENLENPLKVTARLHNPIFEPNSWYENEGYKGGVVYSCGAVVKDGQLFVYYGGADKVSCVATTNLDKFLEELIHSKMSSLKNKKMVK